MATIRKTNLMHSAIAILILVASTTTLSAQQNPLTFNNGDTIVFAGSSRMTQQLESGYLETLLTQASADKQVRFRDLAWQADTVYLRQRPRDFGTQLDWLKRVNATTIIAAYGQLESRDGPGNLPQFIAAYETVLAEFAQQTKHIILITPTPFEQNTNNPNLPDLSKHNRSVAAYAHAIQQLAKKHNVHCVDLSATHTNNLTLDGQQLTTQGQAAWAKQIAGKLLWESPTASFDATSGVFTDKHLESLRQAIINKNTLWRRYWRPTNWAFVYGNRQTQPSSNDHRPGMPRWFPLELQAILPEIEEAERAIFYLHQ